MVGATPMSPRLPSPGTFRVLSDLNEFLALKPKDRERALDEYMAAEEERAAVIAKIEADQEAARLDREEAATALARAKTHTEANVREAEIRARDIVSAANDQATEINEGIKQRLADSDAVIAAATENMQAALDGLLERERLQDEREANAFKEREDVVALREEKVETREREAEALHALGLSTKEGYETLLRQMNELKFPGPKA